MNPFANRSDILTCCVDIITFHIELYFSSLLTNHNFFISIVGLRPVFTKQALMNRQNPKVYSVFKNLLEEEVTKVYK